MAIEPIKCSQLFVIEDRFLTESIVQGMEQQLGCKVVKPNAIYQAMRRVLGKLDMPVLFYVR